MAVSVRDRPLGKIPRLLAPLLERTYEARHLDIFTEPEQRRLRTALREATALVEQRATPLRALDFGCGSGNVTRILLDFGAQVTAADISPRLLRRIEERWPDRPLTTCLLPAEATLPWPDESFDFIAAYSVLHHVPDYVETVAELMRVLAGGGVLYLDHERAPSFWHPTAAYQRFSSTARRHRPWRRYLDPFRYLARLLSVTGRDYQLEGDIHVTEEDHVEWSNVQEAIERNGGAVRRTEDYLLYPAGCPLDLYESCRVLCADTRLVVATKPPRDAATSVAPA